MSLTAFVAVVARELRLSLRHGADTLAAVLREEPKLDLVPAKVRPLLQRCLEKDPELRYQSAKELAAELKRLQLKSSDASAALPLRQKKRNWPWLIVATCLALVSTLWWWRSGQEDRARLPSGRRNW